MAIRATSLEVIDVACPVCGAAPGGPCTPNRTGHWGKRMLARSKYTNSHEFVGFIFRDGLREEAEEAAQHLGLSIPDFFEAAIDAYLASLRSEAAGS